MEDIYATRRFWPEPLISINPNFERDVAVDALVSDRALHPSTGQIFRIDGRSITLYRHQAQALAKAAAHQSFVVTTGTGSGKSLCFFIPIIDAAIRARIAGEPPRTRAIVIYPMNALANSQLEELRKFVSQSDLPDRLRPTFERYTGQEEQDERERIRELRPDILLTNFMMLELLMTRQNSLDQTVISNAQGLEYIVLDELHTYRGRQGADVAMLVRRLRDRLCRDQAPICIGTSATMASNDASNDPAAAVAIVASRLFGTQITSDAIIGESLERATDPSLNVKSLGEQLGMAIDDNVPGAVSDAELRSHPLAVWIELEVGLEDRQRLRRHPPITLTEAAQKLASQTGREPKRCQSQIQEMLILMSKPASERGDTGDRAFLAFKLHQFFCGAGRLYCTLRESRRRVTLDGQLFDPDDQGARLYPTFFCRNCGQEHHPIILANQDGLRRALPRPIDEPPLDDEDHAEQGGYLMPEPLGDEDFTFDGTPEQYPEDWIDPAGRIKSNLRPFAPQLVTIDETGSIGTRGRKAWFLPGKFRFCPACKDQPPGQAREINKLAGLSAEGRSSATTLLVSSTLRWMNAPNNGLRIDKRKVLGFTDNRQDAALQAGHFNDFLFVTLLRAAILAAVRVAGPDGLADEDFGRKVQSALGFTAANRSRRLEWMLDPEMKGAGQVQAERTLSRVLAYRVWADQRRGWRFTNPNLEELGLVRADYISLDELATDDSSFADAPPELKNADALTRRQALFILLDTMRRGLAVTADALDSSTVEATANAARQNLRDPWSISQQENPRVAAALIIDAPKRGDAGVRGEPLILRAGPRSSLARRLGHPTLWRKKLDSKTYLLVLKTLLSAAADYQLVRQITTSFDVDGWRLAANAIRLIAGEGRTDGRVPNSYFVELYHTLANALSDGGAGLFGLDSRAHTAQVEQAQREWREWRFRWGEDDRLKLAEAKDVMRQAGEPDVFLPVLFCSPTMELGVDISALNAVYLRNVPPTPANYAQRSGRAGRSGQAALVITYCAAQSPHDQYYFAKPERMVNGYVRPPAIELANRDLIEAHLHAVWLAETGKELFPDIPHVLDLSREGLPVQRDILSALGDSEVTTRAAKGMERILASINPDLTPEAAPWATDRVGFASATSADAMRRFSSAFDRWRQLYEGARSQLIEANRKSETHGLSATERREAKAQQAQANEQLALLERGNAGGGSDFYTYRYLATEGFLPGYNFPRLPLYAFVPAMGVGGPKAAYLQRARFIAIAEFGPGSLIYHEGRAFRVYKAKLPAGVRNQEGGRIATATMHICGECGAGHEHDEPERCHACGSAMGDIHPVRNVLRIDNVETRPAERITANDEDRQRRGYEIQTTFAWPRRDGLIDVASAIAADQEGPILHIDYASGATICRLNKGLRRRKQKSILGFGIDPATGRWVGGEIQEEGTPDPEERIKQRVVPIVQDNKNAALIRIVGQPLDETAMATLQHALARGLDLVFQLEEGETLTEPVPTRDKRRAILAFEATEGGAGVLGRLITEPQALARVARAALELMHYRNIDEAIAASEASQLTSDSGCDCVKGCYRCLLSYYNQPDQELIDRNQSDALRILLRLARSTVSPTKSTCEGEPANPWLNAFKNWGLPLPHGEPLRLDGTSLRFVWPEHRVAADIGPLADNLGVVADALGYAVVALPHAPGEAPPPDLAGLLGNGA
ncbi:MAG: DEAD/DEAH box helicase [Candidatus Binataceae bacterium]